MSAEFFSHFLIFIEKFIGKFKIIEHDCEVFGCSGEERG